MSQVIRSVSRLPEWYSLASYAPQQHLSLADWLRQFAARADLIRTPRPLSESQLADLDSIRARPIVPAGADELEFNPWTFDLEAQLEGHAFGSPPVRLLSLRGVLDIEDDVGGDELAKVRDLRRRIYPQPGLQMPDVQQAVEAIKEEHLLDRCVDDWASPGKQSASVVVDLSLPDAVLVDAFRNLLPSLRALASRREQGPEPTDAKIDPAGWVRFAVLPYLDLQMWADQVNVRVPNRVLADAIFPPGEGGEEVVRKTTAKLAAAVTTHAFLRRLVSAAVSESQHA